MTRILITGGTGSLGRELSLTLLAQGHQVTILSRDPHRQAALRNDPLFKQAKFILTDICEYAGVARACEGQDVIVHTAALKTLSIGEQAPAEFVRVNVNGTYIVGEAAIALGIKKCLFISSDKSPSSSSAYGTTKRLAECLWLANDERRGCRFSCVRYGNVADSAGAVWGIWRDLVAKSVPITVREPEPTRFLLRKKDAVQLVLWALAEMKGGEILIPANLPAFSLWDLARELQPEAVWVREPLGQGEKQHEILVAPEEGVRRLNEHFWMVAHGHEPPDRDAFCSRTAPQMTGREVVERLTMPSPKVDEGKGEGWNAI